MNAVRNGMLAVAKVDQMMASVDQSKAHLATARTTATHLLDASLRQILTPTG